MNLSSQPSQPSPPTAAGPSLSTPPRASGLMNEPPLSPGPAPDPAPSPAASLEAQVVRLGLMTTAEVATTMQEEAETGRSFAELAVEKGRIGADDIARLMAPEAPAAPPPTPELQLAPTPPVLNVVQPLAPPPPAPEPKVEPAPAPPAQAAVEPEPVVKITVEPERRAEPQASAPTAAPTKANVHVRLTSGERISAGQFDSVEAAERRARELMIAVDTPGNWPRVEGRYIKPDTVVSIDVDG